MPPAGAPGARQNRSNTWARSSGATPGPGILDGQAGATTGFRANDDPHGAAARAVPDRVVDQDHDQLPEPRRIAYGGGGLGIDLDAHAGSCGRLGQRRRGVGRHVIEVERHAVEGDRTRVRAREEEQVVDERRELLDLGVDVLECVADLRDGLRRIPPEMLHGCADHGERRPQLVARVRGELALAAERRALPGQRVADRHQRAAGVDRTESDGDEHDHDAAEEQHGHERCKRIYLGGPILERLQVVGLPVGLVDHALRQDPNGHGGGLDLQLDRSRRSGHPVAVFASARLFDSGMPLSTTTGSRPSRTALP